MAYRFRRGKSIEKQVRKLSCQAVDKCLEHLDVFEDDEAIHQARKEIKKVRSLLRLVRVGIKKRKYVQVSGLLRRSARRTSVVRDAQVRIGALDGIQRRRRGNPAGQFQHLKKELREELCYETKSFRTDELASTQRLLRKARRVLSHIRVSDLEGSLLREGLRRTYQLGRRTYQKSLLDAAPEVLHRWRGRVKDLGYHAQLLQGFSPRLEKSASILDDLGNQLGEHHDLELLLEKRSAIKPVAARLRFEEKIHQRQTKLRTSSLAIGERFFAAKPSGFCHEISYGQK